ncbi:MAG: hypothetical protein AAGB12_12840 [Pseudomonadota bacterium]
MNNKIMRILVVLLISMPIQQLDAKPKMEVLRWTGSVNNVLLDHSSPHVCEKGVPEARCGSVYLTTNKGTCHGWYFGTAVTQEFGFAGISGTSITLEAGYTGEICNTREETIQCNPAPGQGAFSMKLTGQQSADVRFSGLPDDSYVGSRVHVSGPTYNYKNGRTRENISYWNKSCKPGYKATGKKTYSQKVCSQFTTIPDCGRRGGRVGFWETEVHTDTICTLQDPAVQNITWQKQAFSKCHYTSIDKALDPSEPKAKSGSSFQFSQPNVTNTISSRGLSNSTTAKTILFGRPMDRKKYKPAVDYYKGKVTWYNNNFGVLMNKALKPQGKAFKLNQKQRQNIRKKVLGRLKGGAKNAFNAGLNKKESASKINVRVNNHFSTSNVVDLMKREISIIRAVKNLQNNPAI